MDQSDLGEVDVRPQWEYRLEENVNGPPTLTEWLNGLGRERWELVAVNGPWHYFKRQVRE